MGKKVNGVIERQWIYDGQLRPVAEYGPTGIITATFIYGTHINIPDYIVKGYTTYRLITDHLGSLRFVINSSNGTIAQRIDYNDWGNVLLNTAPDWTPFGFAGGIYDKDTKLIRFGTRDYDPHIGRWLSKDSFGFLGDDSNFYSYCHNNPVNYGDPYGFWDEAAHNYILHTAFDGMLTPEEIAILQEASAYTDTLQSPEDQFMHAMRNERQTVSEAENLWNQFICNKQKQAKSKKSQRGQLFPLGMGMHALMDYYAPWHGPFAVWHTSWYSSTGTIDLENTAHLKEMDATPTLSQMNDMANKLRNYYQNIKENGECPCK